MNIRIEISDDVAEEEIVIRCKELTHQIQKIQKLIKDQTASVPQLTFYQDSEEYYFPLRDILFFETSENSVYAHTRTDTFRIRLKLYELEDLLPHSFIRISKSAIVNTEHIMMVNRNLTSSSQIHFFKSHKQVYASRRYYKELSSRLKERSSI